VNRHDCPGQGCAVCELAISEREHPYPAVDNALSHARADGSWHRDADWHVPAGTRVGGGL